MDFEGLKAWLNAQMTSCGAKRDELTRDGRGDEANFEKIRANVFEIFLTVLDASVQRISISSTFFIANG